MSGNNDKKRRRSTRPKGQFYCEEHDIEFKTKKQFDEHMSQHKRKKICESSCVTKPTETAKDHSSLSDFWFSSPGINSSSGFSFVNQKEKITRSFDKHTGNKTVEIEERLNTAHLTQKELEILSRVPDFLKAKFIDNCKNLYKTDRFKELAEKVYSNEEEESSGEDIGSDDTEESGTDSDEDGSDFETQNQEPSTSTGTSSGIALYRPTIEDSDSDSD